MTQRERILAAIAGKAVDRTPFSLWYHFRLTPPAGPNMAEAELAFYRKFRPDLFKVMHDVPYEMPDNMPLVQMPEDWKRLPVLDGRSGNYGAQLDTMRMIMAGKADDVPVIDTVFSTFAVAEKVCGKRTLEFLRRDPKTVHAGLDILTESICNYARALIEAGVDGIYQAITGAASDTMPADEYREHFAAYDQRVLVAANGGTVNVVHQHGVGIYPEIVLGLKGFHIYCWSNRLEGNPSIREMRVRTQACLMAGVDETTFGSVSRDDVLRDAREALAETNGRSFILAPGCAVPTPPSCTDENLSAFAAAVGA